MNYVLKWREEFEANKKHEGAKIMYIGDSWGDFLGSLCCDIHVWMAHDHNQDFTRLIDNAKLFPNYKETVYFVNTWKDDGDQDKSIVSKL